MALRPVSRNRGFIMSDGAPPTFKNAGAPSSGTSGTYAGVAGKGSILEDTTNGKLYVNTNTLASPTWTVVGSQS